MRTVRSQMADFELPSNSADLQGEIREWLKKKRTAEAKVNQVLALLDPARLEVGTKAYAKPEWRKDGPPSMYRAHWRHQTCSILGVEEKDIPEHVVTALKAYVWPNALDTKKADEEAWLIKVPKFLSRVWHDDVNPEEAVGSVRVFVDPFEKDSSKSMTHGVIELKGKDVEDVPKHYILANQPTDMPMHVFSDHRDENVSDMALMGKVAVKLDMRPRSIDDADYHRVSKDRMIKAQTKTRVTQSSSEMRFAPLPKARNLVRFTDAAANKPEKKERMEKKALENMLFGLFERQSYWSLKQLILETKQPVDWLKTNLNEIALLTRRGPNMGLWGLKPEWRQAGVPQQQ